MVSILIVVGEGLRRGLEREGSMLTGMAAWRPHYAPWGAAAGLGAKIGAGISAEG